MPVGALATASSVAAQLDDLAAHPGLGSRRDELTSLADALRGLGDGDLEPWTELDLLQAFAREESVRAVLEEEPEHRAWAGLEVGIGSLVFLPLLLTWLGLSRATSAYEALIGEDPAAAGRPFLQLWQSGFEGRLAAWSTFGHVAGSATAVIFLLVLLAAVHGVRRTRTERRADTARRTADDLLARLVPVLTRAQLLLNERRLSSPQRFAAELTAAATTLGKLGDKAVRAHRQLNTAVTAVSDAVENAGNRLASVDAAVLPLEQAVGRVETAVTANGAEVSKAVESLNEPLERSGALLESAVNGSGVMVRRALEDVRAVNGEVRDALGAAGERVEDSVTVLAAAQRSFTTGTEVAADVSARVLARLGEVTESTAEAVTLSQRAVLGLDGQTEALRRAAERFAELAEAVSRAAADFAAAAPTAAIRTDAVPADAVPIPADAVPADAVPVPVPADATAGPFRPVPLSAPAAREPAVNLAKADEGHHERAADQPRADAR
ncbi:methyl-accepting chemotaxis protein [Streptomyces sp. Isolate_45]|uniref:methyl-accepting chemotaxis protein n=1 Tax=Streptomyces sp. Isolate_45 TaxID=2950111 RepID=UPI0024819A70|nr:methyl-accepting chemotaxis protein [Streptomyces sp. Isolate_45]MDA5278982.1 methyl-accepting chemotaxis protein [Streptomyces sp. Isolate_45]